MGKKYKVNANYFNKWSPTMSYTLGFWYADGSLEDASYLRGKYIRVSSTDKHIVTSIKKWLSAEHPITQITPKSNKHKINYFLRIGDHNLYQSLINHGLYSNKSLTISFPNIPKKHLRHFIRGYFDGDGCAHIEMGMGRKQQKIIKRLSVFFSSGNEKLLNGLDNTLSTELTTSNNRVYSDRKSFQLRYSTNDSIKIFKYMYKNVSNELYFQRKFNIFQQYFSLRPQRVDNNIKEILINQKQQ